MEIGYVDRIWERQTNESIKAFEALKIYIDLGSKRSLELVAKKVGKSHSCIAQWSKKWQWVKRTNAYEMYLDRIEMEERDKRVREALKRHEFIAKEFQKKVMKVLADLNVSNMSPLQLLKLCKDSVAMERESLGVATVVDEVRLHQAQEKINLSIQLAKDKQKTNEFEDVSPFLEAIDKIASNIWTENDKDENNIINQ